MYQSALWNTAHWLLRCCCEATILPMIVRGEPPEIGSARQLFEFCKQHFSGWTPSLKTFWQFLWISDQDINACYGGLEQITTKSGKKIDGVKEYLRPLQIEDLETGKKGITVPKLKHFQSFSVKKNTLIVLDSVNSENSSWQGEDHCQCRK